MSSASRSLSAVVFGAVLLSSSLSVFGQSRPSSTAPVRDSQAITIMNESLTASGGIVTVQSIIDFKESGSITYFDGDEELNGTALVRSRGVSQFRLDASLPTGQRVWAVSGPEGFRTLEDDSTSSIPAHNAIHLGCTSLPVICLLAALRDESTQIQYMGLETRDGMPTHHIRTQKLFSTEYDISGFQSQLTRRDYFLDTTSLSVVAIVEMMHPASQPHIDIPRKVSFSDFKQFQGLSVPTTISESIGDQPTYSLHIASIILNNGFQDSDFQP